MAKQVLKQHAFNAGEFSPSMYGRFDLSKYGNALKTATNCKLEVQGGALRRTGSKFIGRIVNSNATARLIPFQYEAEQGLVLEFAASSIRFFTSGGIVNESTATITGITQANPVVITATSHGFSDNDGIIASGIEGMLELNGRFTTVENSTANTLEFGVFDTTAFNAYTAGGTLSKPLKVSTVYNTDAKVDGITYAQFGNSMYLAQEDHPPQILTRTSDTSWNITDIKFSPPPTVEDGEDGAQTLTLGATTGNNITATAGAAFFQSGDVGRQIVITANGKTGVGSIDTFTSTTVVRINITEDFDSTSYSASEWKMDLSTLGDITITALAAGSGASGETITIASKGGSPNLFRSTDVGKYILVAGGVAKITTYTSATSIECVVQKSLDSTDDTSVWSIEEEEWSSTRGYPRAVAIHENRLVFGGTSAKPQTIWFSESGIFRGFGGGADDEDAITVTLGSSTANEIKWFTKGTELVVGTTGSEVTLEGATAGALSPTNVKQVDRTPYGSQTQTPMKIDNEVIFVPSSGDTLRTFRYDFNVDDYKGDNLFKLAGHLLKDTTIKKAAVTLQPEPVIYAVTNAGDLLVGAYSREESVIGWSKWETEGTVEDVATINDTSFSKLHNNVYILVKRDVLNSELREVELLDIGDGSEPEHGYSDGYTLQDDSIAVSGITLADPAVVTTSAAHGLADGDTVIFHDVLGMTEVEANTYTVANKTSTTFELTNSSGSDIDSSAFTAFTSGNVYKKITLIGGLHDNLEGQEVEVKADGSVTVAQTVTDGLITLSSPAGMVTIGRPYTTTITTLRAPFGVLGSSNIFGSVRPISVGLLVDQSKAPTVNGESVANRNGDDNMDHPVPLFDGFYEYAAEDWNDTGEISITASGPFPLKLLGIFGYYEGSDR